MRRELSSSENISAAPRSVLGALALVLWHLVRAPIYLIFAILEPFVSLVLSLLVLVTLFTALFFRFLVHAPHFPFGVTLGLALACAALLAAYHGLMALLAR